MPSLPKRSCSSPGCRNSASRGSKCDACRQVSNSTRDGQRRGTAERGYDEAHRRMRILAFQRDEWRCLDCGWRPQILVECEEYGLDEPPQSVILDFLRIAYNRGERHLAGDHAIPIEQHPELRLDLGNYRTLCNACHQLKCVREGQGARNYKATPPPTAGVAGRSVSLADRRRDPALSHSQTFAKFRVF